VELDLITDPDMYLMIENINRGGIATILRRYASANNPYIAGYTPDKRTNYITYLDANSQYATSQSKPLLVGNFHFLTDAEIATFDLMKLKPDGEVGYIVECDLTYPPNLHNSHSDYPIVPEHVTITSEMLSTFATNIKDSRWKPIQKLVHSLLDKTKYVTHYRNLQL